MILTDELVWLGLYSCSHWRKCVIQRYQQDYENWSLWNGRSECTSTQHWKIDENVFEINCLRKIEGVSRKHGVRNEDTRSRTGLSLGTLWAENSRKKTRYLGDVIRTDDSRYCKLALSGYIPRQNSQRKAKEEVGGRGEV